MDTIHVIVESIRAREHVDAFSSIWCSRKTCGNAVESFEASWEIPSAKEPTVVVVGIYKQALDDDGGRVTHTLGTVKIDASKVHGTRWYTVYDSSQYPALRMGQARITLNASLQHPQEYRLPLQKIRAAAEKNLQHIAPYGHAAALKACAPHLERIHAPYFRSSSGVMLPSGAFLLSPIVVDDESALIASMASRVETVLRRHGTTEAAFVKDVDAFSKTSDTRLLQIMAEVVSYATLHKVRYTSDTQNGAPSDRWETVRLPHSFSGDCEDCAKDLVLECVEWPKHCDMVGRRGIDAVARLLSYYVPVMVQGAVGNHKHTKNVHASRYMNHEWAALHPRLWFEHITGIENHTKVSSVHRNIPTIVMEGTGEVYPFKPPRHDIDLANRVESMHSWVAADTSYTFYNIPITCSSPCYAHHGVVDFIYTSEAGYGVPFQQWIQGKHGIAVACAHSSDMMDAFRLAMSVERPIRAYTDQVRMLRVPVCALKNPVRMTYICSDNADEVHRGACEVAQKLRDEGMTVEAQVCAFDSRYVCEWYFEQCNT